MKSDTRKILITGGGTGIGLAIAHAFTNAGDTVTIAGRRLDVLQQAANGTGIRYRGADVTEERQVDALFDEPFDVVVANAGGGQAAKLAKTSLSEWNQTLAVNLTGTFLVFRAALKNMPEGGRLIAIASTAALKGNASVPAYTAAKQGVLGLVRSVALDVATQGRGITCNAICPGYTETELVETAIEGLMKRYNIERHKATAMLVSDNPQGRLIDPAEVAATALFLASSEAAAVNGHAMALSGGEL